MLVVTEDETHTTKNTPDISAETVGRKEINWLIVYVICEAMMPNIQRFQARKFEDFSDFYLFSWQ